MKDSQRKDVESGFIIRNKLNILEERVKPKKINKWTDSSMLCDELGSNWTESTTGAELILKNESTSITLCISKNRATHLYECGLRVDSSLVGKSSSFQDLSGSIDLLSSELNSIVDLCSQLNSKISKSETLNEDQP